VVKVALLIGVSEYQAGLNPLPGAVKDVEAMQRVLKHPEMGEFDEVKTLTNPEPIAMQEAIETLFSSRAKDDLALLFFSGHGVKDDNNRLYFATRLTRKNPKGDLVKATAVPAGFVQDVMSNSRCKRQVVLLDCCFSGAFAEGMTAKDDGTVDVQKQLGGEGRAVLTSSTSTQFSFEQQGSELSVYTRYIVEGIETGAADTDSDGSISIDELHEYAQKKVQEAAPAMKPKIYAVEEGFRIRLAKASIGDPKLRYRKEVEQFASRGEISSIGRSVLDKLQNKLGLTSGEANVIEADVLKPYREYQDSLQKYKQAYTQAIQRERTLSDYTKNELKLYQKVLGLREEDIAIVTGQFRRERVPLKPDSQLSQKSQQSSFQRDKTVFSKKLLLGIGAGGLALFATAILTLPGKDRDAPPPIPIPTLDPSPSPSTEDVSKIQIESPSDNADISSRPSPSISVVPSPPRPSPSVSVVPSPPRPSPSISVVPSPPRSSPSISVVPSPPVPSPSNECRTTYHDDPSRWRERTAHLALENNTGRDVQVTLWHSSAETVQGTWTIPPGFHWVPEPGYVIADPWGVQFDGGCIFYLDEVSEYLMGGGDIPFYKIVLP
jgi:hypothetical protein